MISVQKLHNEKFVCHFTVLSFIQQEREERIKNVNGFIQTKSKDQCLSSSPRTIMRIIIIA